MPDPAHIPSCRMYCHVVPPCVLQSLLMGGTSSVAGPWAMPLKARLLILPCEMGAFLGHKLLPSLFPTPGFMRDALADARVPYSQVTTGKQKI